MATTTQSLLISGFTNTNSITVVHGLDRLNLNYRVVCSGTSRPDLVQSASFIDGNERNAFTVNLVSNETGIIQILDSDIYSINLPSPENNTKLVDVLENQFLIDLYQSGSTTTLNESTYTSIDWDAQAMAGSNYTHNIGGTDIRIDSSGTYEISYSVSFDVGDNNRTVSRTVLSVGGTEIPRSASFGYHRTSSAGENTVSKTIITTLSQSDIITLDTIKFTTQGGNTSLTTILNASNITIKKLNNG